MDPGVARAIRKNQAEAFRVGEKTYPVTLTKKRWTMYGTIVAQRRENGQVWLVICGISGPATYAAALLVNRITAALPPADGSAGQVLWAPIWATIALDPSALGDNRKVADQGLLYAPAVWP